MSAGTLTLTNKSAAVSGSGTAFTTELAAGDFIVVTVGGIPYTLPVKTVNSNTSLTLVSNFTGPTQSGAAWYAVPRIAMNLVTAAVVTQAAEALRGLNYDKQNWQSIFSGTGNVTVKLPDNTTWTGPAWGNVAKKGGNSDITSLSGLTTALSIKQGGTGATTADDARKNLGVDSITQSVSSILISTPGQVHALSLQDSGIWGMYVKGTNTTVPLSVYSGGTGASTIGMARTNLGLSGFQMSAAESRMYSPDSSIYVVANNSGIWGCAKNGVSGWVLPSGMTVDSNGFLKKASPIIQLKGDGTAELNDEAQGATVERISAGVYKISGVLGFNADPIWGGVDGGFVIPANTNGLPLLWVDYEVDPDGSITLKTYHRTHHRAPEFARNLIGVRNEDDSFTETVQDGEPVDIPAGRWVDLRVEMPHNSPWNIKQQKAQEAMEKTEREREENQQDTQS